MALQLPGYEDAELVGRGGFATVYRCRQVALGRVVAVKLFHAEADTSAFDSFARECSAVASLDGVPGVVRVYDAGRTAAGTPYLVMEYAPGGSLAQRLAAAARLPDAEVRSLGRDLATALAAAHAAGVLHRDVKPANVLLSKEGRPLLADFGIAVLTDATRTTSGHITATLAHAAPEILNGARATERSDVYSLGSTLFALLAGRPPYSLGEDDTPLAVITRTLTAAPPDLAAQGVDPDLAALVLRCLSREPSERPAAEELAGRLGAAHAAVSTTITRSPIPPAPAPLPAASTAPVVPVGSTLPSAAVGETVAGHAVVVRPPELVPAAAGQGRSSRWLLAAAASVTTAVAVGAAVGIGAMRDPTPERLSLTDADPPVSVAAPSATAAAPVAGAPLSLAVARTPTPTPQAPVAPAMAATRPVAAAPKRTSPSAPVRTAPSKPPARIAPSQPPGSYVLESSAFDPYDSTGPEWRPVPAYGPDAWTTTGAGRECQDPELRPAGGWDGRGKVPAGRYDVLAHMPGAEYGSPLADYRVSTAEGDKVRQVDQRRKGWVLIIANVPVQNAIVVINQWAPGGCDVRHHMSADAIMYRRV